MKPEYINREFKKRFNTVASKGKSGSYLWVDGESVKNGGMLKPFFTKFSIPDNGFVIKENEIPEEFWEKIYEKVNIEYENILNAKSRLINRLKGNANESN